MAIKGGAGGVKTIIFLSFEGPHLMFHKSRQTCFANGSNCVHWTLRGCILRVLACKLASLWRLKSVGKKFGLVFFFLRLFLDFFYALALSMALVSA